MHPKFFKRDPARLTIFYFIFAAIFLFLALGLGYRQIIQQEDYLKQEKKQSLRRILQPGTRGYILDRHGELLVGNRPVFSAVIYLNELRPIFRKTYEQEFRQAKQRNEKIQRSQIRQHSRSIVLAQYIEQLEHLLGRKITLDVQALERHFAQRLLLPFPLIQDLTWPEYARLVEKLPVNGPIQIHTDSTRFYPHGSLAAHVLGYVGKTNHLVEPASSFTHLKTFSLQGKIGRNGLEKAFDDLLQGTSGEEVWVVDPSGFQCERISKILPTQGQTLKTSLDLKIQLAAEKALGSLTGAAVVLEVQTGEVLAMVSHPSYDLNDLVPYIPQDIYDAIDATGAWLNRATQGLYPPGSPFKLVGAIVGLKQGLFTDSYQVNCTGKMKIGNRQFPCNRRWGHGVVDLEQSIAYSCNPFYYQVGLDVGIEALAAEAIRFGFSQPTGIELPYEAKHPIVPTPSWKKQRKKESWTAGDTANTSIGQGFLLTTPLQMACFAASLARGEYITQPTLLHNQQQQQNEPIGLSSVDYQRLIHGMELTTQIGTGKKLHIPGLLIAAKTGTAQVSVKGKEMDLAWCIAFAPIEAPKVAIAVMVEEVEQSDRFYGGTTASPIAREILEEFF